MDTEAGSTGERQAAPASVRTPFHQPKNRPDPGPSRIAFGAGGLAILSAVAAAIVLPPLTAPTTAGSAAGVLPQAASSSLNRPVRYVQLAPGQTAPPGATVIDARAPRPITIVTTVPAPSQRPVVVRTTQSGKVLP